MSIHKMQQFPWSPFILKQILITRVKNFTNHLTLMYFFLKKIKACSEYTNFNFFIFLVELECGQSSSSNVTYFSKTSSSPPRTCQYAICKAKETICRIRFDFEVSKHILITCSWHLKTKPRILQFTNLKYS